MGSWGGVGGILGGFRVCGGARGAMWGRGVVWGQPGHCQEPPGRAAVRGSLGLGGPKRFWGSESRIRAAAASGRRGAEVGPGVCAPTPSPLRGCRGTQAVPCPCFLSSSVAGRPPQCSYLALGGWGSSRSAQAAHPLTQPSSTRELSPGSSHSAGKAKGKAEYQKSLFLSHLWAGKHVVVGPRCDVVA